MINVTLQKDDKLTEELYRMEIFIDNGEYRVEEFKRYPSEAEIIIACSKYDNVHSVHIQKITLLTEQGKTAVKMLKNARENGEQINLVVE